MTIRLLCVHQGWELYGSDRSFLLSLNIIRNEREGVRLSAIVPKVGPIIEPLTAIAHEVLVEDVGSVSSRFAKRRPFTALFRMLRAAARASRRIMGTDAVYINTIVPFGYLIAALFTRKPIIVHVREIPPSHVAIVFSHWFRMIGAHLVFNSHATCRAFGLEGYARGKVILNAVDDFNLCNPEQPNDSCLRLLIIGRINAWKGHLLLVEAIASLLPDERKKIKIRVVGETPAEQLDLMQALLAKIEEVGLSDAVSLFSFASDPSVHFSWSNVVVVPSILPEPFGRVAAEAMSAGRAVIAANHGGLSEIVAHEETGWLFEPGNSESLAAALHDALDHPALVMSYGITARKLYLERFTPDVYKEEFISWLDDILPVKSNSNV